MNVESLRTKLPSNFKQNIRFLLTFFQLSSLKTFFPKNFKLTQRDDLLRFFQQILPLETNLEIIRLGGDADGGYLVPDDFEGINGLVSPGVGGSISFDIEITKGKIPAVLIDASVEAPSNILSNFTFIPKWLTDASGSFSDQECTLEEIIVDYFPGSTNLFLSMDIEGSEWGVINHTETKILENFRIMTMEIHDLHETISEELFTSVYQPAMQKLLKSFLVVHLHPNNAGGYFLYSGIMLPKVIELTLIRKDRVSTIAGRAQIPNAMDIVNRSDLRAISIPNEVFKI